MLVQGSYYADISIHEALASLDKACIICTLSRTISIHEALASLDERIPGVIQFDVISIHEALASLDQKSRRKWKFLRSFRSTRLLRASTEDMQSDFDKYGISIHEALASLDARWMLSLLHSDAISIHEALASLDTVRGNYATLPQNISIHEALASLDTANIAKIHSPIYLISVI